MDTSPYIELLFALVLFQIIKNAYGTGRSLGQAGLGSSGILEFISMATREHLDAGTSWEPPFCLMLLEDFLMILDEFFSDRCDSAV